LRTGTVVRTFKAEDSREVVLRTPKWEDIDDFMELINSLVEEDADTAIDKKTTREEEVDWMARLLSNIEKDTAISIVAEINGRMIGEVSLVQHKYRQRHIGSIGISIHKGLRNIGIGSELLKQIEVEAKKLGLEILTLEVASTNSLARHVYEKAGYIETGRIPKGFIKDEGRVDIISMAKEIHAHEKRFKL
jgi:RimJ/RimL family protein N-acetyltransferase